MTERNQTVSKDLGLLVLRVGVGATFVLFGWGKWQGGRDVWETLGRAMATFGITAWPVFWGFLAMASELVGGLLLMSGLLVRPAAAAMCFTMVTATAMHCGQGHAFKDFAHAVNMMIVFAALLVAGGGRFALGARIPGLRGKWFG